MSNFVVDIQGAQKYSFTDQNSGRLVEGVNVFYMVEGDNINSIGNIPSKITLKIEHWDYISRFTFPIECQLITEQILTKKGVQTKVNGLKPNK